MTGRVRILKALNIEIPDRVPVWIHAINEKAVVNIGRLITDNVPEVKPVNKMNLDEMYRLLEILFLIHEELDIDGFTALGLSELTGVENINETTFKDKWKTIWARSPHGIAYMVEPAIKSYADPFEELKAYTVPEIDTNEVFMIRLAYERFGVKKETGNMASQGNKKIENSSKAIFFLMRGVFVRSWRIRGMQNLLLDMIERPDFVHNLAKMVTDYNLELCNLIAEAGCDVLIVEDDIASKENTLMSPQHYDEFIAPYNKQLVDCAHSYGLKVVRHSDGNLWPVLDKLIELNYDGLNPLEADAGMDLKRVKEYCGDKICLTGNIDCGQLLCKGTKKEVEEEVKKAINIAAPGGGYILASSNSIHPGVDPNNFITMVNAAKKYGSY